MQFEITAQTLDAVATWIVAAHLKPEQFLRSFNDLRAQLQRLRKK